MQILGSICLKFSLYIYSWLTIVDVEPKAPISIAITPRCRERRYCFPTIVPLTLDSYLIMVSVKQGGIKYYFKSL